MLERVAADVVSSTEALATEERPRLQSEQSLRLYGSVVVTTATLKVCTFSAATVSLADGHLPDADAGFVDVPFVRFRKQLSVHATPSPTDGRSGWESFARAKEHTVFVVNASHFENFLRQWTIHDGALRPLMQRG
jgi:hypothetical protein